MGSSHEKRERENHSHTTPRTLRCTCSDHRAHRKGPALRLLAAAAAAGQHAHYLLPSA